VVEEVEKLAAETKPHPFGEVKLPLKRDIGLPGSESPQHIASEIALITGRGRSKEHIRRMTPVPQGTSLPKTARIAGIQKGY
jgi:hypothetical protein